MTHIVKRIALRYCRRFHKRTYWPINGFYICCRCGRRHPAFGDQSPKQAAS
jgi:hypothetical protein